MTVHHLMNDAEILRICSNCKRKIPPMWSSVFDFSNIHYKEFECECGYITRIRVDFIGSGDDSWNKDLDKKIEEVESESHKK